MIFLAATFGALRSVRSPSSKRLVLVVVMLAVAFVGATLLAVGIGQEVTVQVADPA